MVDKSIPQASRHESAVVYFTMFTKITLTHCGLVTPYGNMELGLIIVEVPWHSSQGIIIRWCEDSNQ